jgi:putative sporulation protein YtxC
MLLLTLVYNKERDGLISDIHDMIEYFRSRKIVIGVSESILKDNHFLKFYCENQDYDCNKNVLNSFNLYIANIIYNIVIDEYYPNEMVGFISENYFFLKGEEIEEVKREAYEALKSDGEIIDENSIYCINKKNSMVKKIQNCIMENDSINIEGFLTFRLRELNSDIEAIVDKTVERFMVEKEYNEFIKLLKYFVEIQESKIDEVHIINKKDGSYEVKDRYGINIMEKLKVEIGKIKYPGEVKLDDMLISALITNCPEKIVIHCAENNPNKELIETIKNVFEERVTFTSSSRISKAKIKV